MGSKVLDEYCLKAGDGNLPAHEDKFYYNWAGGHAQGDGWESGDWFGAKWSGYLNVPKGTYTFRLKSDDNSRLRINGE